MMPLPVLNFLSKQEPVNIVGGSLDKKKRYDEMGISRRPDMFSSLYKEPFVFSTVKLISKHNSWEKKSKMEKAVLKVIN